MDPTSASTFETQQIPVRDPALYPRPCIIDESVEKLLEDIYALQKEEEKMQDIAFNKNSDMCHPPVQATRMKRKVGIPEQARKSPKVVTRIKEGEPMEDQKSILQKEMLTYERKVQICNQLDTLLVTIVVNRFHETRKALCYGCLHDKPSQRDHEYCLFRYNFEGVAQYILQNIKEGEVMNLWQKSLEMLNPFFIAADLEYMEKQIKAFLDIEMQYLHESNIGHVKRIVESARLILNF